jgi:hypothetical protein
VAQAVEYLSSNPSPTKKKKKRENFTSYEFYFIFKWEICASEVKFGNGYLKKGETAFLTLPLGGYDCGRKDGVRVASGDRRSSGELWCC